MKESGWDVPITETLSAALARELFERERSATAVGAFSDRHPEITPEDAYAIQEGYAALRGDDGAVLVGRKIGCTSEAVQQLFGIDTPDYGQLFDDMEVAAGGTIALASLIEPMVEPEIAFTLHSELRGPGVTRAQVLAATESVAACLEVIDSRFTAWKIAFVDTVADNGSSARFALGAAQPLGDLDLAELEGRLVRNGEVIASARGSAVLGHPAESVAWLANQLGRFGRSLRAGDRVLSGSLTTAVRARPRDRFEAAFSELGSISLNFE